MRRARLVALYDQVLSRAQIADELGVSPDCVRHLLRRYEVPSVPLWERRFLQAVRGREAEKVAAFLRLRSDVAVASELDLPVKSVVRYDAWRAGRSDIPVAATARRFARSWDDLLVAAYPLVYANTEAQRSPRTASVDVAAADVIAALSQSES